VKLDFCVACGTKENIQHHHLKPASKGGSDEEFNLITLCIQCHATIHNRTKAFSHKQLTVDALAAKKSRGERAGSVPYGYDLADDGQTLIANKFESDAIILMQRLHAKGLSLRKIGAELDKRGIATKKGAKWAAATINQILLKTCLQFNKKGARVFYQFKRGKNE
jgi:hypothetical protein